MGGDGAVGGGEEGAGGRVEVDADGGLRLMQGEVGEEEGGVERRRRGGEEGEGGWGDEDDEEARGGARVGGND